MADPALSALAGALAGAVVSQLLGDWLRGRRDNRSGLQASLDRLAERIDAQRVDDQRDRDALREDVATVRERVAGIEGVLRAALPPTPFESARRGHRG